MLKKIGNALKWLANWRYRSSITGEFVTRKYAEKHPDVTERERADD